MFTSLQTVLFYDIIFLVCFIFFNKYEQTKRDFYKIFPYVIIFFISVTRFDIGADYEGQYFTINEMIKSQNLLSFSRFVDDTARTQGLSIVVFLFRSFPHAFLWINGFYFTIFICSIYYLLNNYNAHKWGILALFLSLLLFQSWDWIKQSAAVGFAACSVLNTDKNNYKKSALFLMAAILFHLSALFVIPILLFKKIKYISSKILAFILIGVFVTAEMGMFKSIYQQLLVITPFYSDVYSNSTFYAEMNSYTYLSTSYIFFSLWSIIIMYFSPERTKVFNLMFFIGVVIYMVSGGSLLMDRISIYYTMSQLVLLPAIMSEKNKPIKRYYLIVLILANIALINRRCFEYGDLRGCTPYETIFSSEFEGMKFRYRGY